jgi:hypothetical protein
LKKLALPAFMNEAPWACSLAPINTGLITGGSFKFGQSSCHGDNSEGTHSLAFDSKSMVRACVAILGMRPDFPVLYVSETRNLSEWAFGGIELKLHQSEMIRHTATFRAGNSLDLGRKRLLTQSRSKLKSDTGMAFQTLSPLQDQSVVSPLARDRSKTPVPVFTVTNPARPLEPPTPKVKYSAMARTMLAAPRGFRHGQTTRCVW